MSSSATPTSQHSAWYLRCTAQQVAERAILVGDRGRALLAAEMLDDAVVHNEDRGLTVATGKWSGKRVTVCAFGMGAPIAAVVLHELAAIGVRIAVRLGTVLAVGAARLGDVVLAEGALALDGTSRTYAERGYPAIGNPMLSEQLRIAAVQHDLTVRSGLIASFDGFYTEMFADPSVPGSRAADFDALARMGVMGADMESAVVLTAGRILNLRTGCLCLASVDAHSHETLEPDQRRELESALLSAGLDALISTQL